LDDGQRYLMSGPRVELAEPRVLQSVMAGQSQQVAMQFSSEQQCQQWLAEQRRTGHEVNICSREEGTRYFTQPYKVELKLGGPEGLKAIGYVALTFLAHYFPQIARQPEFATFKDFVTSVSAAPLVWWDSSNKYLDVGPNPYRFGHRILLGLSAVRQEAYARVSLFSTLDFAVHFGAAQVDKDHTLIIDIDPQADHPPDDIQEQHRPMCIADVQRPASLTANLHDSILTGEGQRRFERLMGEISAWQLDCTVEDLLSNLRGVGALGAHERLQHISELLHGHKQRIVNLMLYITTQFKQQCEANVATAFLVPAVDSLVAADPTSATGLSPTAFCSLNLATVALVEQISRDLDSGQLDQSRLSQLLGGHLGAAIVRAAIFRPLKMALGIT
jgi:hypothetical protein